MLRKIPKIVLHLFLVIFLTLVTQIGGIVYLTTIVFIKRKSSRFFLKQSIFFLLLYLITTLLIVPIVAPIFGREKIRKSEFVESRTLITDLMNRNYVRPVLNNSLQIIAAGLNEKHQGIKLVYLDANFPFINKFPLLPHLSHNDGKKIDIALIYSDDNGSITNRKPSISGYGVFEGPKKGEYNQIEHCFEKGRWQYDFPKYLTFGNVNPNLEFNEKATKDLILEILKQPTTGKLFIEPHLKTRLNLNHQRIRYHGCQAVRHDDHIHFQLK